MFVLAFSLAACGKEDVTNNQESLGEDTVVPSVDIIQSETEPMEMSPDTMGDWSLEECKDTTGIFIAHEDGSFTKYHGGGYLDKNGAGNSEGMFLLDERAEKNSTIGKNDKLVVFCDSEYTLNLLPVSWEVGTISFLDNNGTRRYIRALNYDQYGVDFYFYGKKEITSWNVMYIDGILAKDYPFEIVNGEDGKPIACGLPNGKTINFGVVDGTTLVEVPYTVNATYYNCRVKRNSGLASDQEHYLYPTPTSDGYAVIDVYDGWHDVEVKSGKYVMELRMGRSYIAYLLDWQNI